MTSSSASSTFRIDWRPSRWLACALLALGVLAAGSVAMSDLPAWLAGLAAAAALAEGAGLARRELRRPGVQLEAMGGGLRIVRPGEASGHEIMGARLGFRGPLAWVTGRDPQGRFVSHLWLGDTLAPSDRRALRLAASAPPPSRQHKAP